jgi:hypothetical protein
MISPLGWSALAVLCLFRTSEKAWMRPKEHVLAATIGPLCLIYRAQVPRGIGWMKVIDEQGLLQPMSRGPTTYFAGHAGRMEETRCIL